MLRYESSGLDAGRSKVLARASNDVDTGWVADRNRYVKAQDRLEGLRVGGVLASEDLVRKELIDQEVDVELDDYNVRPSHIRITI